MPSSKQIKTTMIFTPQGGDDEGENFDFYTKFDEIHGKDKRRSWYNNATAAYIAARPRYPPKMMKDALRKANLWSGDDNETNQQQKKHHILEVGCGPGTATATLVKMGYQVTAIDPAPQNCLAARKQCQDALGVDEATAAEQVTIVESTFEDFELDSTAPPVSAILCPTSFHWISPNVACTKTAAILRPTKGCLLLWWAMPPMPSLRVCERLQNVYDDMDESKLGKDMQKYCSKDISKTNLERVYQGIDDSEEYEINNDEPLELQSASFRYSPERFITLLSTLSPYIALEEKKRLALFERLRDRLQGICKEMNHQELELTGYFGFSCFRVKNKDSAE